MTSPAALANDKVPLGQDDALELPHGFTRRQIAMAVSPLIQEFILFPTEKCNFRCTYCYEDFKIGKMSEELQTAFEILLSSRVKNLKVLNFSWFGGEPLLAKDVVLRLARYAKKLCDDNGVTFQGGMTTNAYLLDKKLVSELLECNQNFFQITLDGIDEGHDALRKRADGCGTFDVIWKNLLNMRELDRDFECVLRIHVRRDNFENLQNLMIEIAKEFGSDARFRVDFQHLRDLGGEGGKTVENAISLDELPKFETELRKILRLEQNKNTTAESDNIVDEIATTIVHSQDSGESSGSRRQSESFVGNPYICYAAKPNSLIIRANGRIGKCTVALSDERNDIGYLDSTGELVLNQEKLRPWFRGLETLETKVTGCPIVGLPNLGLKSPKKENRSLIEIVPIS